MNSDKHLNSKLSPDSGLEQVSPGAFEPIDPDEALWLAERQAQIRMMVGRAAGVYLGLFVILGSLMSFMGLNPLANGGLMPKALLIFVGTALGIAMVNVLSELAREQGQSYLTLMGRLSRGIKTQKR